VVFVVLCRMFISIRRRTGGEDVRKVLLLLPFVFSCAKTTAQITHLPSESQEPKPKESVSSLYEKEQLQKLMTMLRQEPTPLAVPPTVLRVFVLPYTTESGELITQHYFYIKVDEGRWIIGDYLLKKGEPIKELKPLEE